jgi:hypothetical protein
VFEAGGMRGVLSVTLPEAIAGSKQMQDSQLKIWEFQLHENMLVMVI